MCLKVFEAMTLFKFLALLLLVATSMPAVLWAETVPTPLSAAKAGELIDLTPAFVALADKTASLPDPERVKAFHSRFDAIVPGYYDDQGDHQAKFDMKIAAALRDMPSYRAKLEAAASGLRPAFDGAQTKFKKSLPDYRLDVPVYLLHSIGTQDGGTRDTGGRSALYFGADVIADIHDLTTIEPFLTHEIFHIYHQRLFSDCGKVWCSLWIEGLAVYAASRLHSGATDRQLLLTMPQPIRPQVEPRLSEAMCYLRARLDGDKGLGELFSGSPNSSPYPPRFGYFLGFELAQKIGTGRSLAGVARLRPAKVRRLIDRELARYRC